MDEYSDLKMLQYYRHDIMNELQLVHGYLQMGNVNRAQEKITNWLSNLHEERKLMYLNAPQFISWILMFNHVNDQIRLSYKIYLDETLKHIDKLVVDICHDFMNTLEKHLSETELYHLHINLEKNNKSNLVFIFTINGLFENKKSTITQLEAFGRANTLQQFKITEENYEIICTWQYPI